MPKISEKIFYNGAEEKIKRLGLTLVIEELFKIVSEFTLFVQETKNSNSGAVVREKIDSRFEIAEGWIKGGTGEIDWTKSLIINGVRVCIGVEIQVSARSDLIIIDLIHLRKAIIEGKMDLGILVVPGNKLGNFLTDRAPTLADAKRLIVDTRADDLPLLLISLEHDGAGPPLPKKRTRQGKSSK